MNETFSDMVSNVGTDVQDTSTAASTIIKRYLNRRYFQVLRSINWKFYNLEYSFTTTSGTQDYVLPRDFDKPVYVRDNTNKRELASKSFQYLSNQRTDEFNNEGVIDSYVIYDANFNAQPTSAATATVTSSSASDTSQSVFLHYIDSNGAEQKETLSLSGTGDVTSSGTVERFISISKDADTVGYVTVTCNSQTIAVIDPERRSYRVRKMRLFLTPNGTTTIACPYIIKPLPMTDDNDYPLIECQDCIEAGARADYLKYLKKYGQYKDELLDFTVKLEQIIYDFENKNNEVAQFLPLAHIDEYDRDIIG